MLTLENVSVNYGAIEALTGINLHVNQGEVVTLIGANGAGKTTTLRTITGLLDPKEREQQKAGTLSGGEQQMLAMARALMSRPRLLLLDEPSLGLAPLVVHTIFEAIDEIRGEGTTILLVEQNANAALHHSDRAYVLETGRIVMEGDSKQLAADPRVKEAYLGE